MNFSIVRGKVIQIKVVQKAVIPTVTLVSLLASRLLIQTVDLVRQPTRGPPRRLSHSKEKMQKGTALAA